MIDLDTAKAHLRVENSTDDALITAYLNAAVSAVQNATGKLLAQAEVTQIVDGFGDCEGPIRLFKGPVAADPAPVVTYADTNGVEQTLASFRLVEGGVARLLPAYNQFWPIAAYRPGSVRIAYTAGYADGEVPAALDQAVLMLVAHYYANREAVNSGNGGVAAVALPLGVSDLLTPYQPTGIA